MHCLTCSVWMGLGVWPGEVRGAGNRTGGEMNALQESLNSSRNSGGCPWAGDTALEQVL